MMTDSADKMIGNDRLISLLKKGHINQVLNMLEKYAEKYKLHAFQNSILDIRSNYSLIAKYFMEGYDDPQREQVINKVKQETHKLADDMFDEINISLAKSFPYRQIKDYRYTYPIDSETIIQRLTNYAEGVCERNIYEDTLIQLFDKLWLTAPYNEQTLSLYKHITQNPFAANEQCLAVSATGLSLWRHFEESKWALLIHTALLPNTELQVRALDAICFALIRHKERIAQSKACMELLHTLMEQPEMAEKIKVLLKQLIRTNATEQVTQKLKTDILPELMKAGQRMQNKFKDFNPENDEDFNPDWKKMGEDSEVEQKMREFGELQMSGADVYFANFAELKKHPFFNPIHRWFMPFDKRQSQIADLFGDNKSILDTFITTGPLCNSDKYSFCLTIKQMPLQQQEMMKENLGQELEQQLTEGNDKLSEKEKWAKTANQYVQDSYRFYHLYHHQLRDIDNPYLHVLSWYNSLLFENNILTDDMQLEIADFIFDQKAYRTAAAIYNKFKSIHPSAALYQKLGYAIEKQENNIAEALSAYEKADLLQPDDKWTLKRMATLLQEMGYEEKALNIYRQLNQLVPNDKKTEMAICQCLSTLQQYDEALQLAYKIYWEHPDFKPALYAIGDISFETGNYQQAIKYWDQLLETDIHYENRMKIGIKYWCMGEKAKGLEELQKAKKASEEKGELEMFHESIRSFTPLLKQQGMNETDIYLLFDII